MEMVTTGNFATFWEVDGNFAPMPDRRRMREAGAASLTPCGARIWCADSSNGDSNFALGRRTGVRETAPHSRPRRYADSRAAQARESDAGSGLQGDRCADTRARAGRSYRDPDCRRSTGCRLTSWSKRRPGHCNGPTRLCRDCSGPPLPLVAESAAPDSNAGGILQGCRYAEVP